MTAPSNQRFLLMSDMGKPNGVALLNAAGHVVDATGVEVAGATTSAGITDATTIGQQVLTAGTTAAARAAIGAGTSNLALGASSTTAKSGDWKPTIADMPAGYVTATTGITRQTARGDVTQLWKGADPGAAAAEDDLWVRVLS